MSAFQATIGDRVASLATLVDEDADLNFMVTHFNKAVSDTEAEPFGKQRWKRKPWVTVTRWIKSCLLPCFGSFKMPILMFISILVFRPEGQIWKSKKISNDQELIQSDPISCPQNQKGNN